MTKKKETEQVEAALDAAKLRPTDTTVTVIIPSCPICGSSNIATHGDVLDHDSTRTIGCLDCHTSISYDSDLHRPVLDAWPRRRTTRQCPLCGQYLRLNEAQAALKCSDCRLFIPLGSWAARKLIEVD